MRRAAGLILVLLAGGALALRLPERDARPFHADESVHAVKCWELYHQGTYQYDANEFHGPTLYYATLPVLWRAAPTDFTATGEPQFRLVPIAFATLLVLAAGLFAAGLGWGAVLVAGALLALSPMLVFYGRYYIQEMLLAAFTLLFLGCGWRAAQTARGGWAVAAGVAAGLMVASKETAVVALVAAALAAWATARRWRGGAGGAGGRSWRLVGWGALAALVVAGLVLTNFGRHPAALLDYLRSYTPWLQRAGGTALHDHPWWYYLQLLGYAHRPRGPVISEALCLTLAAGGLVAALIRAAVLDRAAVDPRLAHFLAVYGLLLTFAYSVIPYKTPWCAVSLLSALTLLAGLGFTVLWVSLPGRPLRGVALLLLAVGLAQLGLQAKQTLKYENDARNPFAYSPTAPDVLDLAELVSGVLDASPQGEASVVQVFSADSYYWPLPWYLRRATRIGWYEGLTERFAAPIILAANEFAPQLEQRLPATHELAGHFALRRQVVYQVWVERTLWGKFQAHRAAAGPTPTG